MAGSYQREESIGSRVKETKSDTRTAKATVIPNWKKKRPTIPFMNATGTKTATIDMVVAKTARPISLVPIRAALKWSSPRSRWRTMFSRTTIASSMRSPTARESAIIVMTLSDIPRSFMTRNDDITEIGSVRPVITVERQELMKQKTIRIVRMPPMIRVCWTSSRDSRVKIELSRTTVSCRPGGELRLELVRRLFDRIGDLHDIGPRLLEDIEGDGRNAVDEAE